MRIGRFTAASKGKTPLHLTDHEAAQHASIGTVVERWGWVMEVDEDVVRPLTFEREWRRRGDDKADAIVRYLQIGPGKDALQAIEEYMAAHPSKENWHPAVRDFHDAVFCAPPDSITAQRTGSKSNGQWRPDAAIRRNDRRPSPSLEEGQAVHWRYTLEIGVALMHFSLAAGFSSQRLISTLQETGYLLSKNREITYRRLLETNQFVIDAMRDMEPVTSQGWRSAVRVRLLHAQVRVRILEGRGIAKQYSVERDGIPLNQEDLAATLAGFCVAPIWACRRMKAGLTEQEELAYIAAWRHIGFYMGVEAEYLERHFARGLSAAEKFLATAAWHLFLTDDTPADVDPYTTTTMRILAAIAQRPPQTSSLHYHVEVARINLGAGLSGRLALPQVPLSAKLRARYQLSLIRAFTLFGRYYRRSWNVQRILLLQHIMVAITAWQLGSQRTRFVAKAADQLDAKYDSLGDGEAPDVSLAGQEVRRHYRALVREMVAVVACVGFTALSSLYLSWRML